MPFKINGESLYLLVGNEPKLIAWSTFTIVKSVALVAVLLPTVTVIAPVAALVGIVAVMLVAVLEVTVAVTPLNLTILLAGAESKFVPEIVTVVPTVPLEGVKDEMVGRMIPKSAKGRDHTPLPEVPAKRLLPLTARDRIMEFVNPVLTAVQLLPLLVERKIPPP